MAKEVLALILAGGQSTRLGTLTKKLAKPAFAFGGKYRIIDFTLSNCANSDINTVGVLTQFEPLVLNSYIGIGRPWGLDRKDGGVNILPPYLNEKGGEWYKGTANAVYQNMDYIDMQNPKYVLVLSGDHIYKMDYAKMIDFHKEKESEATITVIKVPLKEASRFGIMNTREDNSIYEFDEKPKQPKNDLASMGVYLFNWDVLKKYLAEDEKNKSSSHDFGKNIIPAMLSSGVELYAYPFKGYWKDVGTIESLWQANMDQLKIDNELNLFDKDWKIYSVNPLQPPQYVSRESKVVNSMISEGCKIFGTVVNSVLSPGVQIGKGAYVSDTVIMRNTIIRENTIIHRSIIGSRCEINEKCSIGKEDSSNITVVPYDYFMEGGTVYE
ncbi:MAG: glucose-1-phosphate adenylyltransferase [Candidatus Atribacteria bacterium]|nr:glucose-1-phosphate adenylyltransferase [Candidatus Atribacteria bacterium]